MRPMDGSPHGNTENGAAGSKIYRASSYEFWSKDHAGNGGSEGSSNVHEFDFRNPGVEDPPSKLIGQFLHKQQASGDFSLDMDLEMHELKVDNVDMGLPPVVESPMNKAVPKENKSRVSFENKAVSSDEVRIQKDSSSSSSPAKEVDPQVVRCTSIASLQSNSSFRRRSRLLVSPKNTAAINNATRSRLLDPPEERKQTDKSPKSSQSRSGLLGKHAEDDDDDLFLDEDLPEHYKKEGISWIVAIEWVSLILLIGALVCSLTIRSVKSHLLWKLELWKWEVMVLVLICGRLVSSWGIRVIVFLIERNFLLRKRVLYFVYGLRRAVVNCLWLGLVLLAWHFLLDKKVQRETKSRALEHVTKVLVCLLVGTIVWLVKTLIVKVLASSFHVSTYFDRIQEALFNQFVIKTLTGPPLIEMKNLKEEDNQIAIEIENLKNAGAAVPPGFSEAILNSNRSPRCVGSGRMEKKETCKGENGITMDHIHRLTPNNVSAWNMKRLVNVVRHGRLMTLDEQLSNHDDDHDESGKKINSEDEAKGAAKKIFCNVARPGSKYIYLEDLMRFMPEHEALTTMSLFEEASESQKISKSSLKNWAVNVFRERRALALTLDDTKTAVNQLHRMVNVIIGIIIFIVWLLILGIASGKFLLVISSQLLLVAFIFGNSCKTTFEAIIFLFVMHPFDVGDRCEIDGVQMIVEEMNILTTVFLRFDNQKIIFPNSALATKPISNYRRSPDMGDAVEFCVHISTPTEKIAAMKQRITSYIEKKSEHWEPAPTIIYKDMEDLNKIKLAIWPKHRMNHHDMGERWARRALLVEEMVKIFKELDMQYRLFPLDINIRAMPQAPTNGLPPFWAAPSSN